MRPLAAMAWGGVVGAAFALFFPWCVLLPAFVLGEVLGLGAVARNVGVVVQAVMEVWRLPLKVLEAIVDSPHHLLALGVSLTFWTLVGAAVGWVLRYAFAGIEQT